jgi:hypothetical protein
MMRLWRTTIVSPTSSFVHMLNLNTQRFPSPSWNSSVSNIITHYFLCVLLHIRRKIAIVQNRKCNVLTWTSLICTS